MNFVFLIDFVHEATELSVFFDKFVVKGNLSLNY